MHCLLNAAQPLPTPSGGGARPFSQSPYGVLLRFHRPGPGVVAVGTFSFRSQSMVALNFYR
jgi:hypothetical protein